MSTTHPRFSGKTALIIGASGGLGAAFAKAFAAEGARLLLAARHPDALAALGKAVGAAECFAVDLTDAASIEALAAGVTARFPTLSLVINATGYDIRKPFDQHSLEEIDRSLDVNLRGSILITRAFLPLLLENARTHAHDGRRDGMIVHLGGFADGRLAFPFYAANVASRAGLRGFVDAVNREYAGSGVVATYFSPAPADTEAERPFHPLWRQMGMQIVSPEQVAQALIEMVARKRTIYIMGGPLTRFFARLNAILPGLADQLALRRYRELMRAFFTDNTP